MENRLNTNEFIITFKLVIEKISNLIHSIIPLSDIFGFITSI